MGKELEIKILNINEVEIRKKLEKLGAVLESDGIQKIYTYDFVDISSQYQSILYDLTKGNSLKSVVHALSRLKQLFFDLDDLIKEFDISRAERAYIYGLFNTESLYEYVESIESVSSDLINKLSDATFVEIIGKYHINPNKWIRLRENNGVTTLTIKHILGRYTDENGVRHHDVDNVLEYETTVGSFSETSKLLNLLGYYHKNYQEKRRIQFSYNNLEIDIDFWPHIPPYMEIEGDALEDIENFARELGFHNEDFCSLNADDVYTSYGIDMYSYKELKF